MIITYNFRYDSVFLQTTAKAHLDYASCIVDGAKGNFINHYMNVRTLIFII